MPPFDHRSVPAGGGKFFAVVPGRCADDLAEPPVKVGEVVKTTVEPDVGYVESLLG